ncbi:hypothetical protein [Arthrobacter glacialis]|uniref:Uncharacterized protein n=1 Tax=Arthrobacter glacialis TaxID=1664 RepID=A0A2S3ZW55_ARTGL|nr:hypothetical protein [Arthrobacter glacialis]POH73448.1 hypothetical protein CVS27_11110 [Arthrobacter glacialis]
MTHRTGEGAELERVRRNFAAKIGASDDYLLMLGMCHYAFIKVTTSLTWSTSLLMGTMQIREGLLSMNMVGDGSLLEAFTNTEFRWDEFGISEDASAVAELFPAAVFQRNAWVHSDFVHALGHGEYLGRMTDTGPGYLGPLDPEFFGMVSDCLAVLLEHLARILEALRPEQASNFAGSGHLIRKDFYRDLDLGILDTFSGQITRLGPTNRDMKSAVKQWVKDNVPIDFVSKIEGDGNTSQ